MPPKTLSLSGVFVVLFASLAGAQVDLGALLESIGFPDGSTAKVEVESELVGSGALPPSLTQNELPQLEAAPSEPAVSPPSPSIREVPAPRPFSEGMIQTPVQGDIPPVVHAPSPAAAPQVESNLDRGTIMPAPEVDYVGKIDLEELSEQEVLATNQACETDACETDACEGSCDCHGCSKHGCQKPAKVARCYPAPVLPPPASSIDYFKTPRCYNNLWGSYAAEKACECRRSHCHIHETCHCAEKSARARAWEAGQSVSGRVTSGYALPH